MMGCLQTRFSQCGRDILLRYLDQHHQRPLHTSYSKIVREFQIGHPRLIVAPCFQKMAGESTAQRSAPMVAWSSALREDLCRKKGGRICYASENRDRRVKESQDRYYVECGANPARTKCLRDLCAVVASFRHCSVAVVW